MKVIQILKKLLDLGFVGNLQILIQSIIEMKQFLMD